MAKIAAVLGVFILDPNQRHVRAGTLTRDADGGVSFVVSEDYLRDPSRPILSLGWYDTRSDENNQKRLASRRDKIALRGALPPWFAGLLPEGALRNLVLTEMGPGDHDQFDIVTRLGGDLPGAVIVSPETDDLQSAGPLRLERVRGLTTAEPQGMVKFSLAGVQLKLTGDLSGDLSGDRLTLPSRGESGRCIIKLPAKPYPGLPEAEFAAMQLAQAVGVDIAHCQLVPRDLVKDVPDEFLAHGDNVLAVDRFDRPAGNARVHIEDAGQVLGALDVFKYTMGTTDTVMNMVRRFSTDSRADLAEAIRRVTVDVLVGNGDNHLKNWSFRFPKAGQIRLSPAYDIVPTVLYQPKDELALRFVGTHRFESVNMHRFERLASFLALDPKWVVKEVRRTTEAALDLWPVMARDLLDDRRADALVKRLNKLPLVTEIRGRVGAS
ncbi:MAG: type II toxin-antitoxin system HipA family toxin [Pseudomonadota bacterium]